MIIPGSQPASPELLQEHFGLLQSPQHQLQTYLELLARIRKLLFERKSLRADLPNILVSALSSRAIETADAIHALIFRSAPLVDDAMALARVLIETCLNVAFIARSEPEIAERYDAWGDFHAYVQEEKMYCKAKANGDTFSHSV